ncbi:hypothetical protein APSETT444_003121 [Aspergillus pseudonomiae]
MGSQVATRNELVDELIARLKVFHIIRVNGTPASGKTTLMNLMVNKLLESDPATPVYILTGWKMESVRSANGWAAYLQAQTGISRNQWLTHRGYLFLDEAQQSHWDDQLWAELFKAIELVTQIHIVLFMSYGSPTLGFNGFEKEKYIKTPMVFGREQQIALKPNKRFFDTMRALPFTRGLPPANILQRQGVASVLKDAIACDGVYQSSFENKSRESQEALERIWVNGWLHAETSDNEKGPDNELAYSSPLILAIEAIKRFRPYQLSDPLRSITDPAPSPYEDQYQKEFYRCLFPLLDGHAIMSPEFLIKTGIKGGTIDFYVAQKKWRLEVLRNRDGVLEHMQRFEPNGQYYDMIEQGKMEQFIVIDFTNELPKKAHPELQGHLYHVVFSENYRKVRVMDAGLNEVVCFVLMENSSPVH